MRTILEILNLTADYLKQKGIENARRQAEELLSQALDIERIALYTQFDRPLTEAELSRCRSWLQRRAQGEPLQYIAGQVDFYDCRIKVTPAVLIPRQETEILVDKVVKDLELQQLEGRVLWDVCCGSGCIGIAIKKRYPLLKVSLTDISSEALAVARVNAKDNAVDVEIVEGDLLQPIADSSADYLVCNPPYVAKGELPTLDIEVRQHEPQMALVGGDSGIEFYERLAKELPRVLKPGGRVWLEIGDKQGVAIKRLFQDPCWKKCCLENDWSGRERFFSLEIE